MLEPLNVEIDNNVREGMELAIKRFYPPLDIRSWCPECGAEYLQEGDQYLSYPTLGKPEDVYCYCSRCEHEWAVQIVLTLTAEAAQGGSDD